jgi:hypothetical protein
VALDVFRKCEVWLVIIETSDVQRVLPSDASAGLRASVGESTKPGSTVGPEAWDTVSLKSLLAPMFEEGADQDWTALAPRFEGLRMMF